MTDHNREYWASIEEMLFSKDKYHREEAVNTLEKHDEVQAVRLLLKGVKSPSSATRTQIAGILQKKDHPMIITGLIAMLDAPEFHVRKSASDILHSFPGDRTYPEIMKLVLDPQLDKSLRIELIPMLARSDVEDLTDLFKSYIRDDDEAVKHAAIEGLCKSSAPWTITLLLDLLGSRQADIRKRVTDALVKRHSPELITRLLDTLQTTGDSGVQAVAVLSRIGDETLVDRLGPLLKNTDVDVRHRTLLLIKTLDPDAATEHAVTLLSDDAETNRNLAVDILEEKSPDMIFERIKLVFPGTSPGFVEAASKLLLSGNLPAARQHLDNVFIESPTNIKRSIIRGAAEAASDTAITFLKDHAGDITTGTQSLRALGDKTDETATYALVDLMSEPDLSDTARIELIGKAGPELESLMLAALDNPAGDSTKSTLMLLGRIGTERSLKRLLDLPNDFPYRDNACSAIGEIVIRKDIKSAGLDTGEMDLTDIENQAIENGWDSHTEPLGLMLRKSGKIRFLSLLRNRLKKEIKGTQTTVYSLERKIERIENALTGSSKSAGIKLTYIVLTLLGSAGAIFSLYMNWQPKAATFWYPLMVVCAIITGVFGLKIFKFRETKRPKLNIANPRQTLEEYRQKYQEENERIAPTKEQLNGIGTELDGIDSGETTRSLEELVGKISGKYKTE